MLEMDFACRMSTQKTSLFMKKVLYNLNLLLYKLQIVRSYTIEVEVFHRGTKHN